MSVTNTSVGFKRGLQSELDTLKNGSGSRFSEGSFYLTSDTNRLYFAQSATDLAELNQFIHIYTGNSLPSKTSGTEYANLQSGDFYYWTNRNILAIYTGSGEDNGWIQINPDTTLNTNSNVSGFGTSNVTDGAKVSLAITDTAGNTIDTDFSIIGGTNVTVTQSNRTITISSNDLNTTYSLTSVADSNGAIIRLTDSNSNQNDIKLIAGDGITIEKNANNNNITISGSSSISEIENSVTNGVFQTSIALDGGSSVDSNKLRPQIVYGKDQTAVTTVPFTSGTAVNDITPVTATLDVYTADEVDALINSRLGSFDAMTYKGVLANSADAGTKIGVAGSKAGTYAGNVGDTWKVGSALIAGTNGCPVTAKTGDLVIAYATTGNGDGCINWEVVDSGDDQLISMSANATTSQGQIVVSDSISGGTNLGGITLNAGDHIAFSNVSSANGVLNLTIDHTAPGAALTAQNGQIAIAAVDTAHNQAEQLTFDIPIITTLTKDAKGHIVSAAGQTYRFTHGVLSGSNSVTNHIYTSDVVMDGSGSRVEHQLGVYSDNLTITDVSTTDANHAAKGFKIDLMWEPFT